MNGTSWCLDDADAGDGNRTAVRLKYDRRPFEHLPGRAHPRAQDRRMGLGRVMGMVAGMGHRLRVSQPAQEQEADRQTDSDGSEGAPSKHRDEY